MRTVGATFSGNALFPKLRHGAQSAGRLACTWPEHLLSLWTMMPFRLTRRDHRSSRFWVGVCMQCRSTISTDGNTGSSYILVLLSYIVSRERTMWVVICTDNVLELKQICKKVCIRRCLDTDNLGVLLTLMKEIIRDAIVLLDSAEPRKSRL